MRFRVGNKFSNITERLNHFAIGGLLQTSLNKKIKGKKEKKKKGAYFSGEKVQ